MVNKIIELSVKNIFLILILTLVTLGASIWAIKNTSLDALPDLSPPQVILQVKYAGQSPKIIEDQVSYPLISNLMSLPNIETVRAMSSFENALIYVIFKDNSDLYEARNRILEQLSQLTPTLPQEAKISIGPDATGIGWAYQYILKSNTKSLDELRTYQDYYLKYGLLGIDGVSEVAAVGGFVKNYEITLDQAKMVQYDISFEMVSKALKSNNNDTGGRIILENGYEKIVESSGYLEDQKDIENITLKTKNGIPLKLSDIATINIVPAPRRGMADFNGEGEVVGGIVIVRYQENPYEVIQKIKEKIKTLTTADVELVAAYDRTELIDKAIDTLKNTLLEESLIVMLISFLFLFHIRSAFIIIIILPLTVALTFLLMKLFNIGSNIMSLGGIAIAIGAMVDATIVMIENAHKHLAHVQNPSPKERFDIIIKSSKQVGSPIFFALILIVVSFLPIFALTGQEGQLFTPLAYTKTFAMIVGAVLSITLVPILMLFFIKGKIVSEEKNLINRFFLLLYSPLLKVSLWGRFAVLILMFASLYFIYPLYKAQKWEFMPMMQEQTFMYMPVTPYGIGIDLAKELTQKTDKIIKEFPEVDTVFGKAGRAETATDPAPLAMIETIIQFKDKKEWREGMTYDRLMHLMDKELQIPGLINSWTFPIRGRIDMLLTGIRTPLGLKLYGDDNKVLEEISSQMEQKLKTMKNSLSISADKSNSGYYINIDINQEMLSRYNITKNNILDSISLGVGGKQISTMVQGLERYPISLRLQGTNRNNLSSIANIHIKTKYGMQPLHTFATFSFKEGPSVIKSEKGRKVSFVYITPKAGVSPDTYKKEADKLLETIKLPSGYYYEWSGQSKYLESAMKRLQYIIPATILIIFVLIYLALKDMLSSIIVFLTLPFALFGGLVYIDYLGFNLSVAVIVGFLALLGVAAETAIVMIIYLKEALEEKKEKLQKTKLEFNEIKEAIYSGAALRLRPKLMTVFAIIGGLIPIMYIDGVGSEVMQRIAAPMIGGVVSSAILTLIIIPVLYLLTIKLRKEV
jgi:Cu(I)/Ag(I) efflux system membrane protein CusA/SilA